MKAGLNKSFSSRKSRYVFKSISNNVFCNIFPFLQRVNRITHLHSFGPR